MDWTILLVLVIVKLFPVADAGKGVEVELGQVPVATGWDLPRTMPYSLGLLGVVVLLRFDFWMLVCLLS